MDMSSSIIYVLGNSYDIDVENLTYNIREQMEKRLGSLIQAIKVCLIFLLRMCVRVGRVATMNQQQNSGFRSRRERSRDSIRYRHRDVRIGT